MSNSMFEIHKKLNIINKEEQLKILKNLDENDIFNLFKIIINRKENDFADNLKDIELLKILDKEKIYYEPMDILLYLSYYEKDYNLHKDAILYIFNNHDVKNVLVNSYDRNRNIVEDLDEGISKFNLLMTLFLNKFDITDLKIDKKFIFDNKYLTLQAISNLDKEESLNKLNINNLLDVFFDSKNNLTHINMINFKKIPNFFNKLLENSSFTEKVYTFFINSEIKYLNFLNQDNILSLSFLKGLEDKIIKNNDLHIIFLSSILDMYNNNTNNEYKEKLLENFIDPNIKLLNKDYLIEKKYNILYKKFYDNEELFDNYYHKLNYLKQEPLIFNNLLKNLILKERTYLVSKINYYHDNYKWQNNLYIPKDEIYPPLYQILKIIDKKRHHPSSLFGNKVDSSFLKNYKMILNKLIKLGEKPDFRLESGEYPILEEISELKRSNRINNNKYQDSLFDIYNTVILASEPSNLFNEKKFLLERTYSAKNIYKKQEFNEKELENLFLVSHLKKDKLGFLNFSLDIIENNTDILYDFFKRQIEKIITNDLDMIELLNIKKTIIENLNIEKNKDLIFLIDNTYCNKERKEIKLNIDSNDENKNKNKNKKRI